jgi:hypothetical protein
MWPFKKKSSADQPIVVPTVEELTRKRRTLWDWWTTVPTFLQAVTALLLALPAIYGLYKAIFHEEHQQENHSRRVEPAQPLAVPDKATTESPVPPKPKTILDAFQLPSGNIQQVQANIGEGKFATNKIGEKYVISYLASLAEVPVNVEVFFSEDRVAHAVRLTHSEITRPETSRGNNNVEIATATVEGCESKFALLNRKITAGLGPPSEPGVEGDRRDINEDRYVGSLEACNGVRCRLYGWENTKTAKYEAAPQGIAITKFTRFARAHSVDQDEQHKVDRSYGECRIAIEGQYLLFY